MVEQGSFSAAARRLNLTQPAVSLQIRELERRFGLRLIERLGKRAHATIPGRELVEAAQRILRECNHADAAMRRFREGWTGRAHVGTTLTTMIYRLPPILRRVRLDHPGIDLVVTKPFYFETLRQALATLLSWHTPEEQAPAPLA